MHPVRLQQLGVDGSALAFMITGPSLRKEDC